MIGRNPTPVQEVRMTLPEEFKDEDEPDLWEEGRVIHATVGVDSGATDGRRPARGRSLPKP